MTALNRTPDNTNLLQPTKYLLIFDRIPTAQYFCQSANIPGISIGSSTHSTPLADIPIVGDKLQYNTFEITFTVDEKLMSWRNIHDWFRSFASPNGESERNRLSSLQNQGKNPPKPWYSDATLTILTNLNNPSIRVNFTNIFPVSLTDLQFDTKMSADDIITSDVAFVYDQFEIISA